METQCILYISTIRRALC